MPLFELSEVPRNPLGSVLHQQGPQYGAAVRGPPRVADDRCVLFASTDRRWLARADRALPADSPAFPQHHHAHADEGRLRQGRRAAAVPKDTTVLIAMASANSPVHMGQVMGFYQVMFALSRL